MKKVLPNVTLVIIDCANHGEAIMSIKKSLLKIEPAKAIFFTDLKAFTPKVQFDIVKIDTIKSKAEYSWFVMKELWKYIQTDYVLITQHDGWVLNPESWDDIFLSYDYIGSPWLYKDGRNMGNGGFSLRSKRLMEILGTDDFISITDVEDDNTCRMYRGYLEQKYDIKFATDDVGDKFAFELREPICKTFGFHGKFHEPYKPTVVIKRSAALGDIVMIEPICEHYYKNGYHVVLDIPFDIMFLFVNHNFPMKHISQLDERIPRTVINLDGSYESTPRQLHLKSYYDAAGIVDGEIRNPKLFFQINIFNKIFDKYVCIHIDQRDQPYRNIYGVEWTRIINLLNDNGYLVVQVGHTRNNDIPGALQMKTNSPNFLMYLLAGADFFIGIDSGPSNIAVALGIPAIIFTGSVDANYIYPDISKIKIIDNGIVCDTPKCWHRVVSNTGQPCIVDIDSPPCTKYTNKQVIEAINELL